MVPTLLAFLLSCALQGPPPMPKGADMDYGPFLSSTLSRTKSEKDADILAFKSISIRVGRGAAVSFDTDLLRMAAGWTGGFLDLTLTHMATAKGAFPTRPGGPLRFSTRVGPGWARGEDFADPRPDGRGPLPQEWARYRGLYLDGDQVILSYSVGQCSVLECPGWIDSAGASGFTRVFNLGPSAAALKMVVEDDDAPEPAPIDLAGAPGVASLERATGSRVFLRVPPHESPVRFEVILWTGSRGTPPSAGEVPDLSLHCKGGPPRWTPSLETKGTLGRGEGPYVVDTLTLPEANPWKSWFRTSALDFFSDGRVALATWSGDIWVVSGIDAGIGSLLWKRFATGLYEPLGLKIVDDQVYVLGRDQITRLHDLNGDGEADFYESFNNQGVTMASYHSFHYDLQTDREGNFYYLVGGNHVEPGVALHNCLIKVSKDGSTLEPIATGFRATNGMAVGPHDEIVCSDNEGNWIPSSRINWIRKGGFYGFVSDPAHTNAAHPAPKVGEPEKPLCWIPMKLDNSSGGQVWVTGNRWGPLQGHLLHTSYGTSSLFLVLVQQIGDRVQGGVVQFPLRFASGIMRARFSPADGQLYVTGLRGWQTTAARDGCLQRVRYTGKPLHMVSGIRFEQGAVCLAFTDPLDPETAGDAGSYAVEQWNYLWSPKYGSPDYSVAEPGKRGRDPVEVKSAKLAADGKTVTLEIPGLRPVMQMGIKLRVRAADGAAVSADVYATVNEVP